ncbi:hypothetical protein C7212DRAFT_361510 [Tuber magnatum]|uniref:Uncharacterized protein n=1 Tax=Tuber magnatum TaxID=42249 RepID=A0A317T3P8_9PEZI|nr:hypothetical protein C7212DRAFT_361510 [Tuber magnatum]
MSDCLSPLHDQPSPTGSPKPDGGPPSPPHIAHYSDMASQTDTGPPSTGYYTRTPPPYFCNISHMAIQTDEYLLVTASFPMANHRFLHPSAPDPSKRGPPRSVLASEVVDEHPEIFGIAEPVAPKDTSRSCCCCCTRHQPPPQPPHVTRYLEMGKRKDVDPVTAEFSPLMGDVPPARSAFLDIGASPEVGLASLGIFPRKPRIPDPWHQPQNTGEFPNRLRAATHSRATTPSPPPTPRTSRWVAAPVIVCPDGVRNGDENYHDNPVSLFQLVASQNLDELAEVVCPTHGHESNARRLIHSGPTEGYIFKWECETLLWTAKVCTNCEFRRITCSKRLEIPDQKLSPGETPKTHLRVLAVWDGIVCLYILHLYMHGLLKEGWWKNDLDFDGHSIDIDTQRRCGTWVPHIVQCDHPVFQRTFADNGDEIAEQGRPIIGSRYF